MHYVMLHFSYGKKIRRSKLATRAQSKEYAARCLEAYKRLGTYKLAAKEIGIKVETIRRACRQAKQDLSGENKEAIVPEDKIMQELRERFTQKELAALIRGKKNEVYSGVVNIFPEVDRVKFGLISDTHIGSKYADQNLTYEAFDEFERQEVDAILHIGDVCEGMSTARVVSQTQELTHFGFEAQKEYAIEVFSRWKHTSIYTISGNHDDWFKSQNGADIVKAICAEVPCMEFVGHGEGRISVSGLDVSLFHGLDGSSYAISYSLQKKIESMVGGKKPDIIFRGHVHKYLAMFDRHVHAVSVPSIQSTTPWMSQKKLVAHCGYMVAEIGINERKGKRGVKSFKTEYFPAYV